ncbi:hypothetical protein [Aestuariivirga litoralis]|nr:hypothetical protein [Aestuariivirga litoralis]
MISRLARLRRVPGLLAMLYVMSTAASAATLDFTLTTSKPVIVTGTPRLAIDVGGVTRHADYTAGSGTTALTFSYAVGAGDFDANGISLVPPLDLNGGSLTDASGNAVGSLAFTAPDTSGIRIQTYTAAFDTATVTSANAAALSFRIAKAPPGGSYSYSITSSGGAGTVTGSGTISASPQVVSGVDVTSLAVGTLTLSVTVSTAAGGTGAARQATAAFDNVAPSGYSAAFLTSPVTSLNSSAAGFELTGGEIGASYSYAIGSSGGGVPVTGSGTVSADPQQITGLDLSGLGDGTLTLSVTLTDTVGNAGAAATATALKDTASPTIVSVTPPAAGTYDDL